MAARLTYLIDRAWNKFVNRRFFPYLYCKHLYRLTLGKHTDFSHPRDINEKMQWLEYYTDTTRWSRLADKYAVREFVRERVGEEVLVPLLGKWESADDIDFSKLPDRFVVKPNNGSYDCCIVTDKRHTDLETVRAKMKRSMRHRFGYDTAEPHYFRIKPCIVAEQLLETDEPGGLIDYKIWCFDGVPYCFFVCGNRDNASDRVDYNYYDLDWTCRPEKMSEKYRNDFRPARPLNLDLMIDYAARLSKGFPEARIDMYNIHGKIYFGEITFTTNFGMIPFYTQETLDEMGDRCVLPDRDLSVRISSFFARWLPRL